MIDEEKYIIISILKRFLGEPKSSKDIETRNQWEFNCPSAYCKNDHNKFNLAFNSKQNIYKCWKCHDSGIVHKMVHKYGSKEDYKKLLLILPNYVSSSINVFRKLIVNHNLISCVLPEGYTPLNCEIKTSIHRIARDYIINDRKITKDEINKYKIGYTEIGRYKNRIIIPSFNENKNINYFEARAFFKNMKPTYDKPDPLAFPDNNVPEKYDIIFNEYNVNWDLPIYLVEGVFDAFRIPNSIPMLGKTPSWLLISKLIEHNCAVIICLDEDAINNSFELYEELLSLGLDVYFVDLDKKGDISHLYETSGQKAVVELLKQRKKIDFDYRIKKMLK